MQRARHPRPGRATRDGRQHQRAEDRPVVPALEDLGRDGADDRGEAVAKHTLRDDHQVEQRRRRAVVESRAAPGSRARSPGCRPSTPIRGRCGPRGGRARSARGCRPGSRGPAPRPRPVALKPISTRYFVWCTCTAYQANSRRSSRPRSTRSGPCAWRAPERPVHRRPGRSTTFTRRRRRRAGPATPSPSGASPRSSGRCRSSRLSGASSTSTRSPSASRRLASRAADQACSQGSRMIEPTPTPEKAMLIARPRRRTNQLGRKSEWPV